MSDAFNSHMSCTSAFFSRHSYWCVRCSVLFLNSFCFVLGHAFAIRYSPDIQTRILHACSARCNVQLGLLFSISIMWLNEYAVNFFVLCVRGIVTRELLCFVLFCFLLFFCVCALVLLRSIVWFERKLSCMSCTLLCLGMHSNRMNIHMYESNAQSSLAKSVTTNTMEFSFFIRYIYARIWRSTNHNI